MPGSTNLVVGAGAAREVVVDLHGGPLANTYAPLALRLLVGRGAVWLSVARSPLPPASLFKPVWPEGGKKTGSPMLVGL